jgi:hypothetical protein
MIFVHGLNADPDPTSNGETDFYYVTDNNVLICGHTRTIVPRMQRPRLLVHTIGHKQEGYLPMGYRRQRESVVVTGREFLRAKINRATVTDTNTEYGESVTVGTDLFVAGGIVSFECVKLRPATVILLCGTSVLARHC